MINYEKKLKQLRKKIIQVSYKTKEGHISPSFSILDILYVLYNDIMELDDNDLLNENNDHLILSKGHASIGLYTVMSDRGFFNEDELLTFAKLGSRLGGHPDRNKVPGVDVSTGSLGHGLPNAVGIAAGLKIKKINSRVFVIVGDGELNEGSMWESILLATKFKLDNLCCIVDNNKSIERAINMSSIEDKFSSFNWVVEKVNGHNPNELRKVLSKKFDKPFAVIADTIKGHGCKMMEANPLLWHHRSPNDNEFAELIKELQ